MQTVHISHTTRTFPDLPYEAIKNGVMGSKYDLSLVFVGEARAKQLNQMHRKKNYAPDILSFPLDKTHGEIYLYVKKIFRTASQYNRTEINQLGFIFIHGLLHLKGYTHGATMEAAEKKYCKKFNIL